MLNLIIKDILIQKKILLYSLFYAIFAPIVFSSMKPSGFGLYVFPSIAITYMLISMAASYDEKNKSEIILNSLPIKRTAIVISKYISIFVFAIIGIIFSILVSFIGKTTALPMFTRSISLLDIVSILTSVCILGSIFFPVYFKFGFIKMNIFNVIIIMLIMLLPSIAFDYATESPNNILVKKFTYFINNTSSLTQNSLALITGLIFLMISLMISIHIYENKEF